MEATRTVPWCIKITQNSTRPHNQHGGHNSKVFMEEVQRYECIYDKFSKDYKNKYIRLSSWKAIGEMFGLDAPEAERIYKNCRTSYGRYLKKRKSVPSGSRRNAVSTPAEFAQVSIRVWFHEPWFERKGIVSYNKIGKIFVSM